MRSYLLSSEQHSNVIVTQLVKDIYVLQISSILDSYLSLSRYTALYVGIVEMLELIVIG